MIVVTQRVSTQAVLEALREVIDPELDECLVDLGFVETVSVEDDRVQISLRLPTFWCAPNFAYLMANDAREAALGVPGVRQVSVSLKDHMFADEITTGVSCGESFAGVFGEQADGDDLGELRALFRGKAFGMRQEQLVRFLMEAGLSAQSIVELRGGDVDRLPRGAAPLAQIYLERRRRVGLGDAETLITDLEGVQIAASELEEHLRRTRRQRVSMTFNALMCKGLLETRYGGKEAS